MLQPENRLHLEVDFDAGHINIDFRSDSVLNVGIVLVNLFEFQTDEIVIVILDTY